MIHIFVETFIFDVWTATCVLSKSLLNLNFCPVNTFEYLTSLTLLMKAQHSWKVCLSKTHDNLLMHIYLFMSQMLMELLIHLIL